MGQSIYQLSYKELERLLDEEGLNTSGVSLLFNYLYKKLETTFEIPNLSKATIGFLQESYTINIPTIKSTHQVKKEGKTTYKFLISFSDQSEVECVLIPFQGKYTLCLSSQVGCAMKCSFCFTGTQGLTRSLSTAEIVGQLIAVKHWVKKEGHQLKLSNIVFMGQGEPLHNFREVKRACEIFLDQHGLSLAREKITISTAGYLPGLKEWANDPLKVNLALSLHSSDPKIRNELIPLNKAYPLNEVLSVIKKLPLEKKRFVTFEVLLIKGLNDQVNHAHEVAKLVKDCRPLINIIPFNPFPGTYYQRPSDESLENFKLVTESYGIPTMVRKTKGDEILAACGQLTS
jgi:23S rRNA (adenine2503-C2)-methyltransferase